MKILMITPYVPYPPSSGGQIRTYNLLKYLSANHEIVLVCLYKLSEEKNHRRQLQSFCHKIFFCKRPEKPWQLKNIFRSAFSVNPFLIVRNFSQEAHAVLNRLLHKDIFDVIHVETFYVMPHLPKVNIPILLVEQTIEFKVYQHFVKSLPLFLQPLFLLDIIKLKYWERYYWKKASLVATVSASDKRLVSQLEPKINPVIIPNGAGDEMIATNLTRRNLNSPILLFQGNFLWLQNTEAANFLINNIYPLLKNKLKKFSIVIAGQHAQTKLKLPVTDQIKIIDIPPEKNFRVRQLYQKATLFIAPIFGPGGTRLKILAAMANGLPVISTPTGISGLALTNNKNVIIAKSAREFVEKILAIINDPHHYKQIQQQAYQLVTEKYNWRQISTNLEIVYKQLITK